MTSMPIPFAPPGMWSLRRKFSAFSVLPMTRTNLHRLNLPDVLALTHHIDIYGSAFGLPPGEQAWVRDKLMDQIELGGEEQDCRAVLQHFHVFRD